MDKKSLEKLNELLVDYYIMLRDEADKEEYELDEYIDEAMKIVMSEIKTDLKNKEQA